MMATVKVTQVTIRLLLHPAVAPIYSFLFIDISDHSSYIRPLEFMIYLSRSAFHRAIQHYSILSKVLLGSRIIVATFCEMKFEFQIRDLTQKCRQKLRYWIWLYGNLI